jgi:hypothetical protein
LGKVAAGISCPLPVSAWLAAAAGCMEKAGKSGSWFDDQMELKSKYMYYL